MPIQWITADDLPNPQHENAEEMAETASWILYKLTAEKYPGPREVTEWYGFSEEACPESCLLDGTLLNLLNYNFVGTSSVKYIRTRGKPINRVISVAVGSEILPASAYKIANGGYVRRVDGGCFNLNQGVTISYSYGALPPEAGRQAAITLADELIKYIDGDEKCAIPKGVTSVSRQGVDYDILNPQDFISDGKTGIHLVDLFITAANPSKAQKRPKVFSTNKPRGERYR